MIIRLSRETRRKARTVVNQFNLTNAIAFALMGDTTVYLLALHYGASDLVMGLLYSAVFLTGLLVIPFPGLLKGKETTSIFAKCWFMRSWVSLLYLLLPLLSGNDVRCWFLTGIFFVFMILRNVGVTSVFTVYHSVASPSEMPGMMADVFNRVNAGQIVARLFGFVFLGGALTTATIKTGSHDAPWRLIAMLGIGSAFSFVSAITLKRLPASGAIDDDSTLTGSIWGALDVLRRRDTRAAGFISFQLPMLIVAAGYCVNYLRNVAEIDGAFIFLLQLIALALSIPIQMLLKAIGSRIHLRALLLAAAAILVPMGIVWSALPAVQDGPGRGYIVLFYLLLILPLATIGTLTLRLQSQSLPKKRNVELSVGYLVLSALGSLVAVAIVSALSHLRTFTPQLFLHPYSHAFGVVAGVAAFMCLTARRMPDDQGQTGGYRELLQLTPNNLLTLVRAHRVEVNDKQNQKHFALENLMRVPSWAGRELLLENLRSPEFLRRYSAIRMIKTTPESEAYDDLLKAALDDQEPFQAEAVTALGFMGRAEAGELLAPLLSHSADAVRAAALKTLMRLHYPMDEERVFSLTRGLSTFRQRLDVYIGLADTSQSNRLLTLLVDELRLHPLPSRSRVIIEIVCVGLGAHDDFSDIFEDMPDNVQAALDKAFDIAPDHWDRIAMKRRIFAARAENDYAAAADLLRPHLGPASDVSIYDDDTLVGMILIAALRSRRSGSIM